MQPRTRRSRSTPTPPPPAERAGDPTISFRVGAKTDNELTELAVTETTRTGRVVKRSDVMRGIMELGLRQVRKRAGHAFDEVSAFMKGDEPRVDTGKLRKAAR